MARYKVYETCIAEFSAVVEAENSKEAKQIFNKTLNIKLKLESIADRLDGIPLTVCRLKNKKKIIK